MSESKCKGVELSERARECCEACLYQRAQLEEVLSVGNGANQRIQGRGYEEAWRTDILLSIYPVVC